MQDVYIVRAFWDAEAKVWVASGENFIGLATEATTVDGLIKKIPFIIADLLDADKEINGDNIPVQLLVESAAISRRHCA